MSRVKNGAFAKLTELALNNLKLNYPSVPEHALPKTKYSDRNSNALTKCVVDLIKLSGGMAERTGNTGRYIQGNSYTDCVGRNHVLSKGKWIKGSGRNGTADVHGILNGKPIAVEVKIGKDSQSKDQKEYQKDFEGAGGVYLIAKTFEQFYNELKVKGLI